MPGALISPKPHYALSQAFASRNAFTSDSLRSLNRLSNLVGHDRPNKPANGVGMTRRRFDKWTGAALGGSGNVGPSRPAQGNADAGFQRDHYA
jgi:hypothetical protein